MLVGCVTINALLLSPLEDGIYYYSNCIRHHTITERIEVGGSAVVRSSLL